MSGVRHRFARVWGGRGAVLADQGLSSVSNVLAVVLVARALTADEFGRFSLAYATLVAALGLSRSYFGTRISLEATQDGARLATRRVLGALLLFSPLLVLVVFLVSVLMSGGSAGPVQLLVALAAPVVLLQDALRFGSVAGGRPYAALLSDGVWTAVVAFPLVVGLDMTAEEALGLWLCAAVAALTVILLLTGFWPRLRAGLAELGTRHRMGESMAYVSIVGQSASLAVLAVVAHTIGPAGAGALRGASGTMMGPANVAFAFVVLGLTPALARGSSSRIVRWCAQTGGVLFVGVALWGVLVLSASDEVGSSLMGDSWEGVRMVLPITVLEYLALSWNTASTLGLKVAGRAKILRIQRTVMAALALGLGGCVALVFGSLVGVAAALAMAASVSAAIGWGVLRQESGLPRSGRARSGTPGAVENE